VLINGTYKPIKPEPGALVVNLGQTLETISGFKIKATQHRVRDIGRERHSCAFFLQPKFSARISVDILDSSREQCEDVTYDNDPRNQAEVSKLAIFGQSQIDWMSVGDYNEWKGIPHMKIVYDYRNKNSAGECEKSRL
jgi:isopenicillin N synthase-like dioxygenase